MADNLYHFTCDHGRDRITDLLLPGIELVAADNPRAALASPFVWLTDLTRPIRDALGLTMTAIHCDRTVHRYRVTDLADCHRWLDVRRLMPWEYVDGLESAPGARPAHWWVSSLPVPVEFDPIGVPA